MRVLTVKRYYGMKYVTVTGIPVRKTERGDVVDMDTSVIERLVARALIRKGVPIRGIELKFLRRALGLSLGRLGAELGISAPAVLKWEGAEARRLDRINEVAVRALMAEKLKVKIPGKFSLLVGGDGPPERMLVNARKRAA